MEIYSVQCAQKMCIIRLWIKYLLSSKWSSFSLSRSLLFKFFPKLEFFLIIHKFSPAIRVSVNICVRLLVTDGFYVLTTVLNMNFPADSALVVALFIWRNENKRGCRRRNFNSKHKPNNEREREREGERKGTCL